jgi:inhibitor of KinA sporulation pathway (predicted exonuclease)
MKKILDKIIIIDVEATCWEGATPEGKMSEIIEVGVALLDIHTGEISDNEGIIVKPQFSEVSPFCTSLTTLTQEQVNQGISLAEACAILKNKYQSQARVWASFGAYDLNQFQRECKQKGIAYPFGTEHLNVKTLTSVCLKLNHATGMAGALNILDIPLEGTHHRGVDDANNIAKILRKLVLDKGLLHNS